MGKTQIVVSGLLLVSLLVACGPQAATAPTPTPAPVTAAVAPRPLAENSCGSVQSAMGDRVGKDAGRGQEGR